MPFSSRQASLDTNILYYFHAVGRLDLLWALFPEGVWIDPAVLQEIRDELGTDIEDSLRGQGLVFHVEKQFEDRHYVEMAEIKARHRGLKHADIVTIVVAGKRGITCLSADDPVRKTCEERNIPFARHLGCLDEAIARGLLTGEEALALLDGFIVEGLYLPRSLVNEFRSKWKG
ncbi:MAG TPA: hypothetical protein ENJ84_06475 [Gammaproteobacteria bacterium]|nr:hypothetical protein [Gammaproteobacteria bacterium]